MKKVCIICGKEFKTESRNQKYCSRRCWYDNVPNKKVTVKCEFCGKEKKIFPSRLKIKHHFCNRECQNNWQKIFWVGREIIYNGISKTYKTVVTKECLYCKNIFTTYDKDIIFCSNICHMKELNERQKREKHPSWKGGTTVGRRLDENRVPYKEWKKAVFKRDRYRCSICGSNKNINAHHIKTFAEYPELRTELSNGITLCELCHRLTFFKEPLFEDRFYKTLSLLEDVYKQDVRLSFAKPI